MLNELAYVGFYACAYYSEREAYVGVVCPKHMANELEELLVEDYYVSEIDGKHSQTLCDPVVLTDIDEVIEAISMSIYDLGELTIFRNDKRLDPYVEQLKTLNEKVKGYTIKPVTRYEVYNGEERIF